jgi:hypothetical protein
MIFPFTVLALLAFALPCSAAEPQLLLPGEWHGAEVRANDWERWLGVTLMWQGGWELREYIVRVEPVTDPVVDEAGEMTGKRVRVTEGGEPSFLLRGIDGLAPGQILTASDIPTEITREQALRLTLPNGAGLELSLDCRNPIFDAEGLAACPLVTGDNEGRQTIATITLYRPAPEKVEFTAERPPQLLWAGDLDRDGRLDLLIDLSNHYNASSPTLFLSAPAGAEEKLRRVAAFTTSGC